MLTYNSFFSGIGGFDLGFDNAGMICQSQTEYDEKASAVLAHHWPNVKRFKDVRNVGKANLPAVDVFCGGFPCQDVSVAGNRAGLVGKRSGLWFEFLRIITETTPRWVVIENVPGLLSSNGGRDFAAVVYGLAERGYRVAYRVLDAQYFGVAQRRRRVFIVASFGNGSCAEVLFEQQSSTGDIEPRRAAGEGTATYAIKGAAIGRQPQNGPQYGEISADTSYTLNTIEVHAVAGTLSSSGAGTARTGNERNEASFLMPVAPAKAFRFRSFGDYVEGDESSCLTAHNSKDNHDLVALDVRNMRSNGEVSGTLQSKATGGYSLNYINPVCFNWAAGATHGMSITDNASPTLQAAGYGRSAPAVLPEPGYGVRRLTPTECERLQGFPDGWTAVNNQADSTRYKQLGNAVAVPCAEWIGQRIMAVEWRRLWLQDNVTVKEQVAA